MRQTEDLNLMSDSALINKFLERDSYDRSYAIMTECFRMTGNYPGFLFRLIVLDYVSARIGEYHPTELAGQLWMVKARQEWIDYSHLSAYKLRKAIHTLQNRGLIEVSSAGKQMCVRVEAALIDRLLLAAAKTLSLIESEENIDGEQY